ncbi:hypothetical protein H5V45_05335 [Nocardioides sp. KIGAM211]|uniref:Uncharacterized protein n=1 Tax=Nocardioides luti TaxID=2761101 RepID=A0A7X0V9P7_9ACTN|nr:hypothetical protein [Nocardioides luti]MBB6626741.1 hypothetical protein [Nocardioides luti]
MSSRDRHPRRAWLAVAAVAALLVVIGVLGAVGTGLVGRNASSSQGATKGGTLPRADAGWRWVSFRGVAVQVPQRWDYGFEPANPWCMYDDTSRVERAPYVAFDATNLAIAGVGCIGESPDHHPEEFGPAPARFWAPHLSFAVSSSRATEDGPLRFRGWTLTTKLVAGVPISLLTDEETASLTDRILDSARTFDTDDNGCDASSPVQAQEFVRPQPFDVAAVPRVDSIAICQYARGIPADAGALVGSRRLTGASASSVLEAIRAAPAGGGPDTPQTCLHSEAGRTAIDLRLDDGSGAHDLYVYFDSCIHNGFDDGTTVRELTSAACRPLFGDNVVLFEGSSRPFERCHG